MSKLTPEEIEILIFWLIMTTVIFLCVYIAHIYYYNFLEVDILENKKVEDVIKDSCKKEIYKMNDIKGFWQHQYEYRRCIYNEKHR